MPKDEVAVSAAAQADELAILAARPTRIEVYTLDPENDEQIKRKIRIAPLSYDLCVEISGQIFDIVDDVGLTVTESQIPRIVFKHGKAAKEAIAMATDADADYLGSLPADQFFLVVVTVYRVNRAFFVHRVNPIIKALREELPDGAGLTLSTSSTSTDTPTP